ncbi:MAG: membrane protein insertase YidC [Desulfobulbaceae bacterium]|nr:membrane protein insertase YidC [Desulfobulbaceae bacterium]
MDMYRAFLAIIISFLILVGYQYFFVAPAVNQAPPTQDAVQQEAETPPSGTAQQKQFDPPPVQSVPGQGGVIDKSARDITIETPLYTAVIDEQGGGFKSFVLKNYQEELNGDSGHMELVQTELPWELPIVFSLQNGDLQGLQLFKADKEKIILGENGGKASLVMTASLGQGLEITRTLVFDAASYLIDDRYQVVNTGSDPVARAPALVMANRPFAVENSASRFMFSGPVALVDGELSEVKGKKLTKGPQTFQGNVRWSAYEDNYFICAVMPETEGARGIQMSAVGETVRTVITEGNVTLTPGVPREFSYSLYFGPKKLSILKEIGHDLPRAINFGWFDVLAKPMLWLLNFFYDYIRNYGVAIILLTVLIKGAFWPITQKGMKSMKNMQKLQPKVAKLKEKFKGDPQKMNQEMMALYKTYKVNPLGGCLPLVLQIPFFFALYKVLLMSIELRHAPFMLWINDLSAPDRLWIGFDIPFLHGIPVLTLLMGASMYLQQKMTPTTADPTQAKIMQMLPIIFTFMFLNFASGLVLYWFVNNLLSILQQQLINRQTRS